MKVELNDFAYNRERGIFTAHAKIEFNVDEYQDLLDAGDLGLHYAAERTVAHLAVLLAAGNRIGGEGIISKMRRALRDLMDKLTAGRSGGDGYGYY